MDVNDIDIDKLRNDLDNYFTSAMFMVSKFAMMDMVDVQMASPEKLIEIAKKNKFNLNKYRTQKANKNNKKSKNINWFNNPLK